MNYKFKIGTVRFTDETYNNNLAWKRRKGWEGSCYGFDKPMPSSINIGETVYIIEMNNTQNKIMGIGFIKNIYLAKNRTRIYENQSYNRYVFKSDKHISIDEILKKGNKNATIIEFLENILFYGGGERGKHFKRGSGCTVLSFDRIATQGKTIKKEPTVYKCKICGLPKKGHKCSGRMEKKQLLVKRCKYCNKKLKDNNGHICQVYKKNLKLLKVILDFFETLFD